MKKIKIKSHNRTSKNTGKISIVKDHDRISNQQKLRNFIKENKGQEPNKINIVKFVYKDLGIKNKDRIKRMSNLLFSSLSKISKDNNVEKVKPVNEKSLENKKSNFKYYFGSHNIDSLIKNKNSIRQGDTFYNQKIKPNEIWSDTLKRDNIEIIKIGREGTRGEDNKKVFDVAFITVKDKAKNKLKIVNKKMSASKVFKLIKRGK